MKRNEWVAWRLPLIVAALLVAGSAVLLWYCRSWTQAEAAALDRASQALTAVSAAPMPQGGDEVSLIQAQVALPPTSEVPQLMQTFRQSAEGAGITWVEFQAEEEAADPQAGEAAGQGHQNSGTAAAVALDVTVRGTYMQVYKLFQAIDQWPRLVDAEDWDLTIGPQETTAALRLAAYYLPRTAEQEPDPVTADPPGGEVDPSR